MKTFLKISAALVGITVLVVGGALGWYLYSKQPQRSGTLELARLKAPVQVRYDERGVPHIRAENETDMYRALGYVHAQDRLFQMEMARRLAKGELAEILGPDLVPVDTLFRTLGIRAHAQKYAAAMDMNSPSGQALQAYLDGVNQYQDKNKPPLEFNILKIPKRPFTPEDTVAVAGYTAYSFAAAFKTEPMLTFVRDKLGPPYLRVFDTEWHPLGVMDPNTAFSQAHPHPGVDVPQATWEALERIAQISQQAIDLSGLPMFQGSNAWAVSGRKTASGKPLLAGDPHISFSVPSVWFEAHTSYPGYDLYGHYQVLTPVALLGHNAQFGWSITMFENDDIDLIVEKTNPENANQVWHQDQWVDMTAEADSILVRDAAAVPLKLRRSPHGPIITDAFKGDYGRAPIAMWWAYLETENPILQAFYDLNRAETLEKARDASSRIHAPGLNIVWANAAGDIGWWAAAKLPQRPLGVNPMFLLDASQGEAEKPGFYHFNFNPQEENPARGYIVSANHQPLPPSGVPVPGYYLLPDRAQRIDAQLRNPKIRWNIAAAQEMQLDACNGYPNRILKELMPVLEAVITDPNDQAFLEPLQKWDSCYTRDSIAASLFSQFSYDLARAVFADELGEQQFNNLLGTPALDHALPRLAADAESPWWDNVNTPQTENRFETVRIAWMNSMAHMKKLYGTSLVDWSWGQAHTLEQVHPLGRQTPLDWVFNIGPMHVPGGRETPNNFSAKVGPAPWKVTYGPSTRRIIDFAKPDRSVGINPAGQSGVLFNRHYSDQAEAFTQGIYMRQHLSESDIAAHTESTLMLEPLR